MEANLDYWDASRFPRLQRIVFDNTLNQKEALELLKTGEGRVDLVTELSPLETLRVAESPFAKVVKSRNNLGLLFGQFNMRKAGSPWRDVRLRQAVNVAINREDLMRYATKGNGVIVPALLSVDTFGYDPDLVPYPFDPVKARALLREAGHPHGPSIREVPAHRGLRDPIRPDAHSYFQSGSSGCLKSQRGRRLPTTGGLAKLYAGGGEVTTHSSVHASHGSLPATFPRTRERPRFHRKMRMAAP